VAKIYLGYNLFPLISASEMHDCAQGDNNNFYVLTWRGNNGIIKCLSRRWTCFVFIYLCQLSVQISKPIFAFAVLVVQQTNTVFPDEFRRKRPPPSLIPRASVPDEITYSAITICNARYRQIWTRLLLLGGRKEYVEFIALL
jgi:hypothetical protein